MPLRWDPLLVRALARELDHRLGGCHLRALRLNGDTRDMVLLFKELTLAWPLHPKKGAPLLLPAGEPGAGDLPLPARVRRVRAPADERILVIELLSRRGQGSRDLIVELLGNQWNALVVEHPGATIRHVLVRRDGPRVARVGAGYTPPEPSPRRGTDGRLDESEWRRILETFPPDERPRALVRSVAWTSPINRSALVEGVDDPSVALSRGHELWQRWVHAGTESPVLLLGAGGPQPYPFPVPGVASTSADTLLEAFSIWAQREDGEVGEAGGAALPAELVHALERATDAAQRRRTSLTAELDGLEDPEVLRSHGDILLARFGEVPPGTQRVTLADFQGGTVTLDLDPALPVQENAAALYDRAARAERARERLPRLLAAAARKADALAGLLERARRGEVTPEELREALPRGEERSTTSSARGSSLPYRSYRSSGGLEIRVGRGSRHNDALTFRHSAPDDIWLHARHAAGAHVILRWGRDGNPPARDLEEAGVLAALHSKARTSGTVPVDWTRRKYVRKPRGAAPGSVVPQRAATLFVAPDERLAERLSEE